MLVVALAGLSSYLCRLYPMCKPVQARGLYLPHHSIYVAAVIVHLRFYRGSFARSP
jgi:hypothetical protein